MTEEVDAEKRATLRRFAAFGATAPFVGTDPDNDDTSQVREAIRGYLLRTPGAHFSKLRDDLQLGTGETQHHLKRLVNAGTVESLKDGDYRRFYPAEKFTPFEKQALGYLRRDTPRGMILALLEDPDASGADIARRLDVSRATVSGYAADLEEIGLLDREDDYALRRPETIIALVTRYADSFGSDAVVFAGSVDELIRFDP